MQELRESDPCRHWCQHSTSCCDLSYCPSGRRCDRSQVGGIYLGVPLKRVAAGPSMQAGGRRASDKQLFVPGHVLPSSPRLYSPLHVHFCCRASLSAADSPLQQICIYYSNVWGGSAFDQLESVMFFDINISKKEEKISLLRCFRCITQHLRVKWMLIWSNGCVLFLLLAQRQVWAFSLQLCVLKCGHLWTQVPALTTPHRRLPFEGAFHILGQLKESLWAAGCRRFLDRGQRLQHGAHISGDERRL